jgi:hypothetical protein
MYNSIILSSCLFGSFYLCSRSLLLINMSLLENKKLSNELIVINGLTFLVSGSIIVYNFSLLNSCYFKFKSSMA